MRILIPAIACVLAIHSSATAQKVDTTWRDEANNPCLRAESYYYRCTSKQPNGRYKVSDYRTKGNRLFEEGYYDELDSVTYTGSTKHFDEDGNVAMEGSYTKGKKTGKWITYYSGTTNIWVERHYDADSLMSLQSYYENGQLKRKEKYNGAVASGTCYSEQGSEMAFTPFETMPVPGFNINEFISQNIKYPRHARKSGVEGRVIVKFLVDENGKIGELEAKTKIGEGLEEEALRVVGKMPRWKAGIQDDKNVKVYYTLPIRFQLED